MKSCAGRQIYLVGECRLLSELLASVIADRTTATCSFAATLGKLPPLPAGAPKRLILYDFGNGRSILETLNAPDTRKILKSDYLVLINLPQAARIEADALQHGVRGFLYREGGIDCLLKMVKAVLNAELWVSRELVAELLTRSPRGRLHGSADDFTELLTPREIDILHCISEGRSNAMIADTYCLSPHTVKTHLYHIYKKINVSSRLQAAQWVARHC